MRLLGIPALLFLAATALADPFGPPAQYTGSAPYVAVASTNAGPVLAWVGDDGTARVNGDEIAAAPGIPVP